MRDVPQKLEVEDEYETFIDFPQKLKLEDVTMELLCETSLKN